MIYISKQESMKSMFSWNKANALDGTGRAESTLQSISVGVNELHHLCHLCLAKQIYLNCLQFISSISLASSHLQQNKLL